MSGELLSGTLEPIFESGYEAAPWAFVADTSESERETIRPGDDLVVYGESGSVVFARTILIGEGRGGFGDVYWYPKGIRKNKWVDFFVGRNKATLRRGVPDAISDLVARVMTWHHYLTHIESFASPMKDLVSVRVACYFPDARRKPVRIEIYFENGVLRDVRPL